MGPRTQAWLSPAPCPPGASGGLEAGPRRGAAGSPRLVSFSVPGLGSPAPSGGGPLRAPPSAGVGLLGVPWRPVASPASEAAPPSTASPSAAAPPSAASPCEASPSAEAPWARASPQQRCPHPPVFREPQPPPPPPPPPPPSPPPPGVRAVLMGAPRPWASAAAARRVVRGAGVSAHLPSTGSRHLPPAAHGHSMEALTRAAAGSGAELGGTHGSGTGAGMSASPATASWRGAESAQAGRRGAADQTHRPALHPGALSHLPPNLHQEGP